MIARSPPPTGTGFTASGYRVNSKGTFDRGAGQGVVAELLERAAGRQVGERQGQAGRVGVEARGEPGDELAPGVEDLQLQPVRLGPVDVAEGVGVGAAPRPSRAFVRLHRELEERLRGIGHGPDAVDGQLDVGVGEPLPHGLVERDDQRIGAPRGDRQRDGAAELLDGLARAPPADGAGPGAGGPTRSSRRSNPANRLTTGRPAGRRDQRIAAVVDGLGHLERAVLADAEPGLGRDHELRP